MKKVIIAITAVSVLAVLVIIGVVIFSTNAAPDAVLQNDVVEPMTLKTGKYFKENGTSNEYIEVFDDGTIQMFGYDYWGELIKLNGEDEIESQTEEAKQEMRQFGEYLNARHEYVLNDFVHFIHFKDSPDGDESYEKSPFGFERPDENTIIYDKNSGHIYYYAD